MKERVGPSQCGPPVDYREGLHIAGASWAVPSLAPAPISRGFFSFEEAREKKKNDFDEVKFTYTPTPVVYYKQILHIRFKDIQQLGAQSW
ncbi:MAG TPA: hypothetical protein VD927_05915 [Chryseosolibacter sp.]|nr:hypothetical protein [Chryseosolibacter sp.]